MQGNVFVVLTATCSRSGGVCRRVVLDITPEKNQGVGIGCATGQRLTCIHYFNMIMAESEC